jgi:hypothetical protein
MVKKLVGISMLAAALSLTAGCATTAQVEEAKKAAADAQATANKAAADAARANACCNDTNAKIDRMFQKSMRK